MDVFQVSNLRTGWLAVPPGESQDVGRGCLEKEQTVFKFGFNFVLLYMSWSMKEGEIQLLNMPSLFSALIQGIIGGF